MENKGSSSHQPPPSSSSFSSTLDNNNNRSSKSLRLQTTLAELELKIEKILEVVEDNGDTFAQRAQMYYQKRPELIEMLGDLRKSYRGLADKVVTIRSESIPASNCFCCSSTCNNHHSGNLMIFDHQPRSHDDSTTSECHDYDDDDRHRRRRELIVTEQQNNNNNNNYPDVIITNAAAEEREISSVANPCDGENGGGGEEMVVVAAGGGGWDELLAQVTELMEENTSKQAELIRRYAKKNEDMKLLVKENRRLRELLSHTKINDANKQTSSQTRWKPRHFFRKLLP